MFHLIVVFFRIYLVFVLYNDRPLFQVINTNTIDMFQLRHKSELCKEIKERGKKAFHLSNLQLLQTSLDTWLESNIILCCLCS